MSKHNEKKISQLAKQINKQGAHAEEGGTREEGGLVEQYRVIKDDLMKLRDDLTRGYDMAKDAVDKKTIVSELMKLRSSF
ncbi:MAG: hypothetical protein V4598_15070 [Bdellovibrionota bacterium]